MATLVRMTFVVDDENYDIYESEVDNFTNSIQATDVEIYEENVDDDTDKDEE